jgi:hypothetical protein
LKDEKKMAGWERTDNIPRRPNIRKTVAFSDKHILFILAWTEGLSVKSIGSERKGIDGKGAGIGNTIKLTKHFPSLPLTWCSHTLWKHDFPYLKMRKDQSWKKISHLINVSKKELGIAMSALKTTVRI